MDCQQQDTGTPPTHMHPSPTPAGCRQQGPPPPTHTHTRPSPTCRKWTPLPLPPLSPHLRIPELQEAELTGALTAHHLQEAEELQGGRGQVDSAD